MSRIAGSSGEAAAFAARRKRIPLVIVILASFIDLLPVVVSTPLVPDFAFMVLIAWRLLRPEMWSPLIALPLGLFNDLVAGHPLGQSMALWTLAFLAFDVMESRVVWRDYLMDWLFAALAITFYSFGSWYISKWMGNQAGYDVMVPQLLISILVYPVVARVILSIDRWRLS